MLPDRQSWRGSARLDPANCRNSGSRAETCRPSFPRWPVLFGYQRRRCRRGCDCEDQLQQPNIPVQGSEPTISSGPQVRAGRLRQPPDSTSICRWSAVVLSNSSGWTENTAGNPHIQTGARNKSRLGGPGSSTCGNWTNDHRPTSPARSRSGFAFHASERRFGRGCRKRVDQRSLAWLLPSVRA